MMDDGAGHEAAAARKPLSPMARLVNGFGIGPRMANDLAAADLSMTATEYTTIILLAAAIGFLLGWLRGGLLVGTLLAIVLGYVPIFYLGSRRRKRRIAFTNQLPEILTLLVGALRAGHGLTQALNDLVEQMPAPASVEFSRVTRAINLGLPVARALNDMAQRIGTDDVDIVVTAIVVQSEMGGNLALTLETISDTVRDRIRMKREIRVLTSQQRMTGTVLALLPLALAGGLTVISPNYMKPLLQPGWIRLLPVAAVVMQLLGFFVINRILDIEV